jgi:O-antigen/teichoic acid export membrane protein
MNKTAAVVLKAKNLLVKTAALARQPLFANAGYLTGVNLMGAVVGFVFWGLAARLYRPEDVGLASAVLSAVVLVSGIASLGIGDGLIRFLSQARSPHRLLNTACVFSFLTALLIGGVFLVGLPLWSPKLVSLRRSFLYTTGFLTYAAAETLGAVIRMAFVARRQALYAFIYTGIVNSSRLLLIYPLSRLGVAGLVGSVICGVALAVAVSLLGFLPRVEPGYRPSLGICWSDLAAIVPYSAGNYFAGLLAQTSQMALPIIILEVLGPTHSGYAYIAWMLGGLLASPGMALAVSAFAEGANSPQKLAAILGRSAVFGLLLTVSAALIVGVAAPYFLLFFGSSYAQEASGLLRWMAAEAPLVVLTRLYFTYLRVQKRIGRLILFSGLIAIATLGIAIVWMPRFGIAASGMGWLAGNGLVAAMAVGDLWRGVS